MFSREEFNRIFREVKPDQQPDELFLLVNKVVELNPHSILEIGIAEGGTLKFWELILEAGDLLVGVDMQDIRAKIRWKWQESNRKIEIVIGDSTDPRTVVAVKELVDNQFDFLFIDGNDHLASKDFENYSPMVREGGLVAFHDIDGRSHKVSFVPTEIFRSLKGIKEEKVICQGIGIWWKQ